MLIEGLHLLRAAARDVLVELAGLGGILDALLDRPGAAHDLDRRYPAALLLVREQPQGDHRFEVVREARADLDFLLAEMGRLDHSVEELLFHAGEPKYEMAESDLRDPVDEAVITRLRDRFRVEVRRDVLNTDADVLVVRSSTKITAKVIEAAKNLKIIARPGVGVDNIDIHAAAKHTDSLAACCKRSLVRLGINAIGKPGDHGYTLCGQIPGQRKADLSAVAGGSS